MDIKFPGKKRCLFLSSAERSDGLRKDRRHAPGVLAGSFGLDAIDDIAIDMNHSNLLMIFAKNPDLGKVKTRLAQTVGEDKALYIYLKLLEHTHAVADLVEADKIIYFSDRIEEFGMLDYYKFAKLLQKGESLGERMDNAFGQAFATGYEKVVVIGSDCYELSDDIITTAYELLQTKDVVVGPAKDGGYYLLGMRRHYSHLFRNKAWSTPDVLLDTILDLKRLNLSYELLPTLSDVDKEEDLGELRKYIV